MVLRRFRKEALLAGFAAEAQPSMVVADKAKLSATGCAAILRFGHQAFLPLEVVTQLSGAGSSRFNSSALCACRQQPFGIEISKPHCRRISAALSFGNKANAPTTFRLASAAALPRLRGGNHATDRSFRHRSRGHGVDRYLGQCRSMVRDI
jgi:hypothetical protein